MAHAKYAASPSTRDTLTGPEIPARDIRQDKGADMSVQSEWLASSKDEPAEFTLDYAGVKVQAVKNPESDEIQVRIATEFDTDWMECKFDEWQAEWEDTDLDEKLKDAYPLLKRLRAQLDANDRALIDDVVNELEACNPGLIRG